MTNSSIAWITMIENLTLATKMLGLPSIAIVIAQASSTMPPMVERWGVAGVLMLNIWWLLSDRKAEKAKAEAKAKEDEKRIIGLVEELRDAREDYRRHLEETVARHEKLFMSKSTSKHEP